MQKSGCMCVLESSMSGYVSCRSVLIIPNRVFGAKCTDPTTFACPGGIQLSTTSLPWWASKKEFLFNFFQLQYRFFSCLLHLRGVSCNYFRHHHACGQVGAGVLGLPSAVAYLEWGGGMVCAFPLFNNILQQPVPSCSSSSDESLLLQLSVVLLALNSCAVT